MRIPPRQVIVPTDFQDDLNGAVEVAVELAGDPGRVHVLHVLMVHTADEPGLLWNVLDEATRRDHVLERLRRELNRPGLTEVGLAVGFGNPGERIVQYARDLAAELIVIPSHSERGLTRWLLGSVAERVVRLADCPVLILKSDSPQAGVLRPAVSDKEPRGNGGHIRGTG